MHIVSSKGIFVRSSGGVVRRSCRQVPHLVCHDCCVTFVMTENKFIASVASVARILLVFDAHKLDISDELSVIIQRLGFCVGANIFSMIFFTHV